MHKSCCFSEQRSTQRQGDKRSAPQGYLLRGTAADLIASHAPLRDGRHKARQNSPKHYPGDPTGAAAPLVCLSPLSFFKQRKMGPPEVASKAERQVKTYSERWSPRRALVAERGQKKTLTPASSHPHPTISPMQHILHSLQNEILYERTPAKQNPQK